MSNVRTALLVVALAATPGAIARAQEPAKPEMKSAQSWPVLDALEKELERSTANLAAKGEEPLYYLSYRVSDGDTFSVSASYGALESGLDDDPTAGRVRLLDVSARVGSRKLDNTHKIRGGFSFFRGFGQMTSLPIEDDPAAIRVSIWRATDRAYKAAAKQLIEVRTNKAVKVEEEDKADDFSEEERPSLHLDPAKAAPFDRNAWKAPLKRLSALFKDHPYILSSSISIQGGTGIFYFVDSEGARIREPRFFARLFISGSVKAEDGMDLELYDSVEATTLAQLPTEPEVERRVKDLIARLEALRTAPVVEPYTGPAIILNRAAAVYFHEVFGHRIEGHRQKDEDEGQTFTKKVNQKIMPDFMSVVDDPLLQKFGDTILNGHYGFDEEGVPAQKVQLVEHGVLRGFLMGRSPIKGFSRSNGHGRAQPGLAPVARQGVLMAESTSTVKWKDLRARLIEEAKKRGKPYALMFDDIAGGFTNTERFMPQAFKVLPLIVYRVYVDGRPDELVRGVDLVGTPLASLEKILVTGDDPAVFNGYCGAESGFVPVSAVAPSLLVAEIEVEKKEKGSDRLPIEPPPLYPDTKWPGAGDEPKKEPEKPEPAKGAKSGDGGPGDGARSAAVEQDLVFKAIDDELARARKLSMSKMDTPYWLEAFANDQESFGVAASFGAMTRKGGGSSRSFSVGVRVGAPSFDNTNFRGDSDFFGRGDRTGSADELDYDAFRHDLWIAFDESYKAAVEKIAEKRAFLETNTVKEKTPDFGPAPLADVVLPRGKLSVDKDRWTQTTKDVSALFRAYPWIYDGSARFSATLSHQYLVTTDPVRQRFPEPRASFGISVSTQAEDGMDLSASADFQGRTEADLPGREALMAAATGLAARLDALTKAPLAGDYTGPVLFTGRAAATFFLATVGDPLSHPRAPLGASKEGRLVDRIGKRVASRLISVRDDPTVSSWRGKPLLGYFPVDDDGVKPVPITLIDAGVLKTYYMSRVPTELVKETNGHARAGQGSVGNLFVEAKETRSRAELKKELVELASDEDQDYGLLVEDLGSGGSGGGSRGSIGLPSPVLMWRVYADGREELVRGGSFKETTYRVLKDIVAVGDDPTLVNTFQSGQHVSVVAPSVLVKGLELRKPRDANRKPPSTTRPVFAEETSRAPLPPIKPEAPPETGKKKEPVPAGKGEAF